MESRPKRLYRSTRDRKIWGVCGGLAEYFNADPVLVRVAFVALVLFSGVGILLYLILAVATPSNCCSPDDGETRTVQPTEQKPSGTDIPAGSVAGKATEQSASTRNSSAAVIIGVVLIVIGIIILLANLHMWWAGWRVIGPILLILIGLMVFFVRRR